MLRFSAGARGPAARSAWPNLASCKVCYHSRRTLSNSGPSIRSGDSQNNDDSDDAKIKRKKERERESEREREREKERERDEGRAVSRRCLAKDGKNIELLLQSVAAAVSIQR
jgi:hypothetical protein